MFLRILIVFCVITFRCKFSLSQVLQFGTCTDVETMKYFDIEKFLGKWYEIERFPAWYEDYGNCAYKNIQLCGRQIEIEHGFVRDGVHYILHVNSTYMPGDEAVFVVQKNNIDPIGIPLSVTATDYSNYAIVYGCKNSAILGIKFISAWILSRNTTLSPEILNKAYLELNALPYASIAHLQQVPQDDEKCNFYWTAHVQAEDKSRYYNFIH